MRFTVQGNAVMEGLTVFLLSVDGHEITLPGVGTHIIPISPGNRVLRACSRSLWRYGEVEVSLEVAPGQIVDIFYAPPYHNLAPGALGVAPLKRSGLGVVIGLATVVGAIILVLCLLMPILQIAEILGR